MALVRRTTSRVSRRSVLVGSALAGYEILNLGLGAALGGCGESTTGKRITVETRVTSDLGGPLTTADGWEVTVDRAMLAVGDLIYLTGAPIARRWSPIREAHAHPGHYRDGDVLGEAHVPTVVDLTGSPVSLAVTEAVTGFARSATFAFHDPAAGAPATPEGAVALVAGTARRDGEDDRVFSAHAFATDVLSTVTELPEVTGCPLEDGDLATNGVVSLEVQVGVWLEQIDFAQVPATGAVVDLARGEPPHNAFARGLRKAAAYRFTFTTT